MLKVFYFWFCVLEIIFEFIFKLEYICFFVVLFVYLLVLNKIVGFVNNIFFVFGEKDMILLMVLFLKFFLNFQILENLNIVTVDLIYLKGIEMEGNLDVFFEDEEDESEVVEEEEEDDEGKYCNTFGMIYF